MKPFSAPSVVNIDRDMVIEFWQNEKLIEVIIVGGYDIGNKKCICFDIVQDVTFFSRTVRLGTWRCSFGSYPSFSIFSRAFYPSGVMPMISVATPVDLYVSKNFISLAASNLRESLDHMHPSLLLILRIGARTIGNMPEVHARGNV
jgi:hypothetical protein